MKKANELAKVLRSGKQESLHFGHIVLADNNVWEYSDSNFSCFVRSCIKPIQAKVAKDILGEDLSGEILAIACSSHLGEARQLELINFLMGKFAIKESDLLCGISSKSRGSLKSKLYHNCSGKHLAIIAACKKKGWSTKNYLSKDHPYNQNLKKEIKKLLNSDYFEVGQDDCGLPSYHMRLKDMARIFLNLGQSVEYREIIEVMNEFPYLIGGESQIDSILMSKYPGKFLAKGGAEGLMAIYNIDEKKSLIIKIIDGSNRAKSIIVSHTLKQLKWIKEDLIPKKLTYDSNMKVVGEIISSFKLNFDLV